MTRRQLYW